MTAKTGKFGLLPLMQRFCKIRHILQFASFIDRSPLTITSFFSAQISQFRSAFFKLMSFFVMALFLGVAGGCSSQISQHGHLLTEADLAQVQVGMSKQQVNFLLGTPDTTATYTGDVYYYISSKMETKSFLPAKEIERRVVAVYFAPQIDTVQRVAHYGLQDGKVIDFISRETPSHGQEASLLTQLFRGLGAKTNIFE